MAIFSVNPELGTVYEGEYFELYSFLISDIQESIDVIEIIELGSRNDNLIYRLGSNPKISGVFDSVFLDDAITSFTQLPGYVNRYDIVNQFSQLPEDAMQIVKYQIDQDREETVEFELHCLEGMNPTVQIIKNKIRVRNNFSKKAIAFKAELDRLDNQYARGN